MAKIYISSTYVDLKKEREAAAQAVRRLLHQPIAMEDYVASDKRPVDKCLQDVRSCDAFIGIFALRYGYIPDEYKKSITHLEYETAEKAGIPCLIFLLDEDAPWPAEHKTTGEEREKIDQLRNELKKGHTVSFFKNADQLDALVTAALSTTKIQVRPSPQAPTKEPEPAAVISKKDVEKDVETGKFDDAGKKAGRTAFIIVCIFIFFLVLWNEIVGPRISKYRVSGDIDKLIHSHCWITYNVRNFTPGKTPYPGINKIRKELTWIKKAGFNGIITFSSEGTFSLIPELAKELGFSVIMGVWNPNNPKEISAAIRKQKYADAYCVGHNGLNNIYSYDELVKTVNKIRFLTRNPVSTTEKISTYLSDKRLIKLVSWIFPDTHVSIKSENRISFLANAKRDAAKTINMANEIANIEERGTKPILLKMVTYPMRGISNASPEEQARFYFFILDSIRDSQPEIHIDVSISVHSAFDEYWKTDYPFYDWDSFTGLLDNYGNPRPAVKEIVRRLKK
jgi:exo-beta-1,3-glucanase (GH17 family)